MKKLLIAALLAGGATLALAHNCPNEMKAIDAKLATGPKLSDADMANFHVVLFGDPGSNQVMARMLAKLPVKWTRETVKIGDKNYPAAEHFPALIYPNPLNPAKYVVLNTGLTITDREYNGDYGMPQWGDYAIVKVKEGSDVPDMVTAGLFDEQWRLLR